MSTRVRPADLLLKSNSLAEASDELIAVTPEQAGWQHTSLIVRRLGPGDTWTHATGPDEVALVPLGGSCRVTALGQEWRIGGRVNPFAGQPSALYLPRDTELEIYAEVDVPLELAICGARADETHDPVLIQPEDVEVEIRGAGNAARQINHIVKPEFPAHRLLVVEVFTPSGNWSSYPSHKHDVSDLPREADLEEIYYYRLDPPDGFGLQRLYTADGRIDQAYVVRDGDLLLVPGGYHVFAVAHGYTGYYLNVLAGNETVRTMQPSDDPTLAWVRATWSDEMNASIRSWRDIDERINGRAGRRD